MTKEIDLLSLGKSETSTSVNTNTSKKEGLSLFDSLLVNSKTEGETNTDNLFDKSSNNTKENKSSETKIVQNTKNQEPATLSNTKTEVNIETKNVNIETENNKELLKQVNTSESKVNLTITDEGNDLENKSSNKQQSTTSMIDRIVLESNKNAESQNIEIKNISGKELDIADENKTTTIETKENKSSDEIKNLNINKEINSNNSSLNEKIEISTKTNNLSQVNIASENSGILEGEKLNTIKKDENGLSETKILSEQKNIKTNLTNLDDEQLNNTKIENLVNKETLSSSSTKIDAPNEDLEINGVKNQKNDLKTSENTKTVEIKLADNNIENDLETNLLNSKSNNTEIENNSKKIEPQILDNSKEQIQTTMNFSNSGDSEIVADDIDLTSSSKIETKLNENEPENIDKNQKNIENIEDKNDNTKVTQKTDILSDIGDKNIDSKVNEIISNEEAILKNSENLNNDDVNQVNTKVQLSTDETNQTNTKVQSSIDELKQTNIKAQTNSNEVNDESLVSNFKDKTVELNTNKTQQDFSKLDAKAFVQDDQRVNLDKEILTKETPEIKDETNLESFETRENSKSGKSLMDRLFDNAKAQTISTKNVSSEDLLNNETLETQSSTLKSNDVATNIFLSSQKNSIYTQMIVNKSEGVKTVKNAANVEDVKEGAKILNLGLEDASVEVTKKESKVSSAIEQVTKNLDSRISLLNKIAFEKNMTLDELTQKLQEQISTANSLSSSVSSSTVTAEETVVNMNVNSTLALSIQNKIVGAQQQMSSMMSDVARNMYENYKPPVTAFRLNLFPAQLGQIAILMKNDKENSISINMNISQSATLDAFVENQSILRDALNRNFENSQTSFDLSFNMDDSSGSSFENGDDAQDNQKNSSEEIIESIVQKEETEETNYM